MPMKLSAALTQQMSEANANTNANTAAAVDPSAAPKRAIFPVGKSKKANASNFMTLRPSASKFVSSVRNLASKTLRRPIAQDTKGAAPSEARASAVRENNNKVFGSRLRDEVPYVVTACIQWLRASGRHLVGCASV